MANITNVQDNKGQTVACCVNVAHGHVSLTEGIRCASTQTVWFGANTNIDSKYAHRM